MGLRAAEEVALRSALGRRPTPTELAMVEAEWSEHCSYKSSRAHLGVLPRGGLGGGLDSGAIDAGGGYVVTAHVESHNHPSAVEPYGGAATGVGGIVRDILSAGTRPIALLDGLRFGGEGARDAWLFRSAVAGIADYGNCLGIPTVGGEVGFDPSYSGYAVVDVAAVGFGRRGRLVRNRALPGDAVWLVGGPTGMDGVGGAQFASDGLGSEDRSAVQIPDPFVEKMAVEAVLEARDAGIIRAMKDLGGGGLACALSETADALGVGFSVDTSRVHTRGPGMGPREIMVSESQERMLLVVPPRASARLASICARLGVPCSEIGRAERGGELRVSHGGREAARIPARVVARAPRLDWPAVRPERLARPPRGGGPAEPRDLSACLEEVLSSPNVGSRAPVYGRYDHEVGLRTVVRPGRDAALLRLDNGRYLALSMDANPWHCHADPRAGAAGCLEEACRNVACAGARPAAMLDHMQFGSPEDPGVFWEFLESLRGMAEFARAARLPCIGGKVSLYNETPAGPIKPTPVAVVLGLADRPPPAGPAREGDWLVAVGRTLDETGGSEYESLRGGAGGACPRADAAESGRSMGGVLSAMRAGAVREAHDCSRGGAAAAVSRMCARAGAGCRADMARLPGPPLRPARALFSESHMRYMLAVPPGRYRAAAAALRRAGAAHARLGRFGGGRVRLSAGRRAASLTVDAARAALGRPLEGAL